MCMCDPHSHPTMETPSEISDSLCSSGDRLIKEIQTNFSTLVQNQQAQAEKQEKQAERLLEAVEALKQKSPISGPMIKFWNAHKTLADERDKELKEQYSTDLNTALVFAGLFSAVDSAFIIQIQPGIQPRGTATIIVFAQSLLYISLGSTLLAAMLAVHGMQWLMHYSAEGEKGTLDSRGLALSVYLWSFHLAHAIIAIMFTSVGLILYFGLLISAAAAPDSPFQTPLSPLIRAILDMFPTYGNISGEFFKMVTHRGGGHHKTSSGSVLPVVHDPQLQEKSRQEDPPKQIFCPPFPEPDPEVPAVTWMLETSSDPQMIEVAAEMATTLQWPFKIDISLLDKLHDGLFACFDCEWDENTGRTLTQIIDKMAVRALKLGRAYCVLHRRILLLPDTDSKKYSFSVDKNFRSGNNNELEHMVRVLAGEMGYSPKRNDFEPPLAAIKWALQVIPSFRYQYITNTEWRTTPFARFLRQFNKAKPLLDPQSFTDYLLCLHSFLSHMNHCDMARVDKRMGQLEVFKSLLNHLSPKKLSMEVIAKIIQVTVKLATQDGNNVWIKDSDDSRQSTINEYCSSLSESELAGWHEVVLSIGQLSKTYDGTSPYKELDCSWVFKALERVNTSAKGHDWAGVAGLFNNLLNSEIAPLKKHLPLVLSALKTGGHVSRPAAQLLLQKKMIDWFKDEELRPMLLEAWSNLISLSCASEDLQTSCIQLGNTLARMPDWQPHVYKEFCSWITIFFNHKKRWEVAREYSTLLHTVWSLDTGKYKFEDKYGFEEALGLTFMALFKVWENPDYTQLVQLLRCTNPVVVRGGYGIWVEERPNENRPPAKLTAAFVAAFSKPLHASLTRVSAEFKMYATKSSTPTASDDISAEGFGKIAGILDAMTREMLKSKADVDKKQRLNWENHWKKRQVKFSQEIDELKKLL
ncbi:hypothetical protein B0H19DRAFT_1333254 [Mycena capillaripes]|nr:hypothetical protein B0H19DRAFT_1333254 [Mycena capillaripes]